MSARGELTQGRIELAALALFAEKGVDRTTINDIALAFPEHNLHLADTPFPPALERPSRVTMAS